MPDRYQRSYLSRRVCWMCGRPLDEIVRPRDCGSQFEPCSQEIIDQRRADCLARYKPRPGRRGMVADAIDS